MTSEEYERTFARVPYAEMGAAELTASVTYQQLLTDDPASGIRRGGACNRGDRTGRLPRTPAPMSSVTAAVAEPQCVQPMSITRPVIGFGLICRTAIQSIATGKDARAPVRRKCRVGGSVRSRALVIGAR